jgi:putative ABC transport system substrate-binding protein
MIRALFLCLAVGLTSVHAQQGAPKRVGYFSAASAAVNAPRIAAFRRGMAELGWVDGKDYIIDARYGDASSTNLTQLATDVVASRPDVILTPSDSAIRALAKATSSIPIVFATASDPIGLGVAKSFQAPGGNVTGLAATQSLLGAKRVQLLKETFPHVSHIGVLVHLQDVASGAEIREIEKAAARLGLRISQVEIREASDVESAVKRGTGLGCQAYLVADGFLVNTHRARLTQSIRASKLPAIFGRSEFVDAGGLMSYDMSTLENFRLSARYVDKILKGAKPGDLPIAQASKFELTVNLKTAKAIGITVPTSLLVRADKVIQ